MAPVGTATTAASQADFEEEEEEDTGADHGTAVLGDLVQRLLTRVEVNFGNTLSQFGRDLFIIDGDALLGYLVAEEPVLAAASAAMAAGRAAGDAVLGSAEAAVVAADAAQGKASALDTAGHPVFDFQTLPLVFRVEQFLTHLFELGAEFRLMFMQVHAAGWTAPYALLRQATLWHLRNCTRFIVDTEVVHPWHASWADYVSLHLPSYILGCTDWEWPGCDSMVLPRTGVLARAFTLSLLAEGRSVVLLRGIAEGERVDVGSARFDAFWLSRISGAVLLRQVDSASVCMQRIQAEIVPGAVAAAEATPGSLASPAPAWPHAVLCTGAHAAAVQWGGWRLAVAVDAVAMYLNALPAGNHGADDPALAHALAMASLFLWHAVAMQHLPVERRAIPASGLRLGGLDTAAGLEMDGAALGDFVAAITTHLHTALTSAAAAHCGTDVANDDAAASAGASAVDARPACMTADHGQAASNVADLVDVRLLRFLHITLPRALAAAGSTGAAAVFGGDRAPEAAAALTAAWSAVGALLSGDTAEAAAAFDVAAPSPLAPPAGANRWVRATAAAAASAKLPAPKLAPMASALSQSLLGTGGIADALSEWVDDSPATAAAAHPFPFGDSYCWHQGKDFAKLPEAFDKVKEPAGAAKKVLTDRERKTLQRKANAVAVRAPPSPAASWTARPSS